MRRQVSVNANYEDVTAKPSFTNAVKIADDLMRDFMARKYDEIYLAYNHFNNPLSQTPLIEKLMPIDTEIFKKQEASAKQADYIFEPEDSELLAFLVPKYLNFKIYFSLLENAAGEMGAKMTAMDNATRNAGDMINRLTISYNRQRQANITKELIEIISGAEAL